MTRKQTSSPIRRAAFVVSSDGRIVRALSGLGLSGTDLRLALVDAGQRTRRHVSDQVRLRCFGFDPARGIYTASITRMMAVGGAAMIVLLFGGHCGSDVLRMAEAHMTAAALNDIATFTTEASRYARNIDFIFYGLTAISGVVAGLVVVLVVGFSFRYYRGSTAPRGALPQALQQRIRNRLDRGDLVPVPVLLLVGGHAHC